MKIKSILHIFFMWVYVPVLYGLNIFLFVTAPNNNTRIYITLFGFITPTIGLMLYWREKK